MSQRATVLWQAVLALLVVLAAATWVTVVWLSRLPFTDDSGRSVLYFYWHHTSGWWFGVLLAAAAALSLILVACVLLQIVLRLHGLWQVMTMAVGGVVWLCAAAYLAVLCFFVTLGTGLEGTQTIARGSDGTMVMITQDGFDGDVVGLWRPATSVTYLRDPYEVTVDPRSGPCRLDREAKSQMKLTCGSTSQLWYPSGASVPAPSATAPLVPAPRTHPTPTQTPSSVSALRPCQPGNLTLAVGDFGAATGVHVASLRASNRSASACYLDGFATVELRQGSDLLDLKIGTMPSEQPGMEGRATRVAIAPGHRARLSLSWRGYGTAADSTSPQTLDVLLRPGAALVPVEVPSPRFFDLIDGGELRVGNWLATAN